MKLRKTLYLFIIGFIILMALPSCHKEKVYKIGVSQCSDDDWREKMNQEIMREAMFHNNVDIEIRSAGDSNQKQIDDIKYFADHGFDIIIVAPNEAEPITPAVDDVMAKGIPVVIFDRNVVGNNFTAFQGADNDSIGMQAARYVRSKMPADSRIIEIYGNMGSTPAQERHEGFKAGLGDMKIIAGAAGNWNYDRAYRVADSLLSLYPDVDVIYAHNDRMALAADAAAEKHGIDPYIIGVDAAPEIGLKAVSEGKIDATFIYPTEGYQLIRTALAILEGGNYQRNAKLPAVSAVDKSNADILFLQNDALKEETEKIQLLKSQVDTFWDRQSIQTTFLYVTLAILLVLFVFLFLFLRSYWQKQRQQKLLVDQNLELERQRDNEKMLNRQLHEATQSKLMFFTNVSHDLRTPLTLIADPVRQLASASNLTPQQKALMNIADKNVRILNRLINQVLDFRKYENGRLTLQPVEVDIRSLVADWTDSFKAVARKHNIKLSLDINPAGPDHIALDVEKIERVFFNLLSNAFKYTPDNGDINVSLWFDDKNCHIVVKDTGRGISADDIGNIFDRFFQVDKVHPNGSGIGLSLAKAFVEMHDGTIQVESEPGKGSAFSVTIPVRHVAELAQSVDSHISDSDISAELDRVDIPVVASDLPETDVAGSSENGKPILLVIDDNQDILALVSSLLSDTYTIITALNGADGLRLAAKYVPDLIVCDVMMPVMDGLECCRRIKEEVSTSHIPVLMLTACSMDEQRVQGYESGADAYISKPFNSDVLRVRCGNLIDNRRRIKNLWHEPGNSIAPVAESGQSRQAPSFSVIDSDFYRRFLELLHKNIADSEISVDALAAELGFGRSQFYRKIKALTNYSPVELIRNIRLKEARNLLLTSEKTVSEIAYAVGFSTPAYFTKCYRDAYGETPSETRTSLNKN